MELRQSPAWTTFLGRLGWQTELIDGCALRVKKLGPFGCIIKVQRPDHLPLAEIENYARSQRALFLKIEALNQNQTQLLLENHFQLDSWPLTPTRTVVLDLSLSEEALLG